MTAFALSAALIWRHSHHVLEAPIATKFMYYFMGCRSTLHPHNSSVQKVICHRRVRMADWDERANDRYQSLAITRAVEHKQSAQLHHNDIKQTNQIHSQICKSATSRRISWSSKSTHKHNQTNQQQWIVAGLLACGPCPQPALVIFQARLY